MIEIWIKRKIHTTRVHCIIIIIFLISLYSFYMMGQISHGGIPLSLNILRSSANIPYEVMPNSDLDAQLRLDLWKQRD